MWTSSLIGWKASSLSRSWSWLLRTKFRWQLVPDSNLRGSPWWPTSRASPSDYADRSYGGHRLPALSLCCMNWCTCWAITNPGTDNSHDHWEWSALPPWHFWADPLPWILRCYPACRTLAWGCTRNTHFELAPQLFLTPDSSTYRPTVPNSSQSHLIEVVCTWLASPLFPDLKRNRLCLFWCEKSPRTSSFCLRSRSSPCLIYRLDPKTCSRISYTDIFKPWREDRMEDTLTPCLKVASTSSSISWRHYSRLKTWDTNNNDPVGNRSHSGTAFLPFPVLRTWI